MARKLAVGLMGIVVVALLVLVVILARLELLAALWIPLAMALVLLLLPIFAVTLGKSMLEGLFDIDLSPKYKLPVRMVVVTLAAYAVAGIADAVARLMLLEGPARFQIGSPHFWPFIEQWICPVQSNSSTLIQVAVLCFYAAWVAGFAIAVSRRQDPTRSLGRMLGGAALAIAFAGACAGWLIGGGNGIAASLARLTSEFPVYFRLGPGYVGDAWVHQVEAILSFTLVFFFYLGLGWYGRTALGKTRTIPALAAPLMSVMILGGIGSGFEFFLGRWHIPLLLLIAVGAVISSALRLADHTYAMVPRMAPPAPAPVEVLTARKKECAIVVASAGGGIQAAAWTAQVLEGLSGLYGKEFEDALCLISSISGGSTGSACYVNWLANPGEAATPVEAASASSLDEVAWGLAWPDLWRLLLPWPFGMSMDRAHALEIAWQGNAAALGKPPQLGHPLSGWNQAVKQGELPAVIMNSTMVEVGGPLLLGTSDANGVRGRLSYGWEDGDDLHQVGGAKMDIPVVRAARLSATFPYVTPVARPDKADHQPHMCDGGLYDNFGMATLTDWVDQALESSDRVRRILVIQINGFPNERPDIPKSTQGGWLDQLIAPVVALASVRTTGQMSHRDIELKMLQDKWNCRGVEIKNVIFDFNPAVHGHAPADPPLSWHLMPLQVKAIREMWEMQSCDVDDAKKKVGEFLAECKA